MQVARNVVFELTLKCNLNCSMCSRKFLQNKTAELPIEELQKILEDLNTLQEAPNISFGGYGEPLLYPRLVEAIKLVKDFFPSTSLVVTTNAVLLDKGIAESILSSGLDYLRISLNATTPAEYARLMGSNYDKVTSQIEWFLAKKKESGVDMKVGLQILDTQKNRENFTACKEHWEPLFGPKDFIACRTVENRAGAVDAIQLSGGIAPDKLKERWPCFALWRDIAITATGDVYPCCEAYTFRENDTLLHIGNCKETPIDQLLTSPRLEEIRNMHLENTYDSLPECSNCTKPINYPNVWTKENNIWVEKA